MISGGVYAATAGSAFSWGGLGAAVGLGALTGAVGGGAGSAVTGALAGSIGATAAGFAGAAAGGAAAGGVGYGAGGALYGYSLSWAGFGMAAGLGAATGLVFAGADLATGGAISRTLSKPFSFLDDAAAGAGGGSGGKSSGGTASGSGSSTAPAPKAAGSDDFLPEDPADLFKPLPEASGPKGQPSTPGPGGGGADPRMKRIIDAQDAAALKNPQASCATAACDVAAGRGRASQIDRAAFRAERAAFWKAEAQANPDKYTAENLTRMRSGRAPIGADGESMELHHVDGTPEGELTPMTRTDHRLGENYLKNHPWLRKK